MAGWYNKIVAGLDALPEVIDHFELQLEEARHNDLNMKGRRIEIISAELPGVIEQRYNQLQEIEAILEYMNGELNRIRSKKFREFLENYNRALSSRDAEKYVDGDKDVVSMAVLVNEVALLRNRWLGLHKALEAKNYMISNITRLRCAGLDDATIE